MLNIIFKFTVLILHRKIKIEYEIFHKRNCNSWKIKNNYKTPVK